MTESQKAKITEWIAALRSGDYKQGEKILLTVEDGGEKRYCCLGVACELARKNNWIDGWWEGNWFLTARFDPINEGKLAATKMFYQYLPPSLAQLLGITPCCDLPKGSAASMNDNGATFEEIADAIEDAFLKQGIV